MTKIWKKKVTCTWAQISLATTQTPYDAYTTLQAILEGTDHTLDENKPQMKKDENKTNDVLLALKESREELNALMARNNKESERRMRMERLKKRIQHDGYKRKRDDEDRWP